MLAAFRGDSADGCYVRLFNHTTNLIYNVCTITDLGKLTAIEPAAAYKPGNGCFMPLAIGFIVIVLGLVLGWFDQGKEIILGLIFWAFVISYGIYRNQEKKYQVAKNSLSSELGVELNDKIEEALLKAS